jgi:hypothetical protein
MKTPAEVLDAITESANDVVVVKIDLPLPTDVAATLVKAIGLTYPNTMIADDKYSEMGWMNHRQLVLHIAQRDRQQEAKTREEYEAVKEYDGGGEGQITELTPNSVAISPHEELTNSWVFLAKETLKLFPDAKNYLETVARDRETGDKYVFYVARSEEQTPHALRRKAEEELAAEREKSKKLRAEVARLKRRLCV